MHKYVVGKQGIRMHTLKHEIEDIDPVEVLDFLNQLQRKYAYHSNWGRCYFSWLQDQNITIFEFWLRTKKTSECFSTFVTWKFPESILVTQRKLIFVGLYLACKK